MTNSRNKGKVGEREVVKLLRELFDGYDFTIERNLLSQARSGGVDVVGVPGIAIEVKRAERLQLDKWFEQARRQAAQFNARPVLFFRQSRQPWRVMTEICDATTGITATVIMEWPQARILIRAWVEHELDRNPWGAL